MTRTRAMVVTVKMGSEPAGKPGSYLVVRPDYSTRTEDGPWVTHLRIIARPKSVREAEAIALRGEIIDDAE